MNKPTIASCLQQAKKQLAACPTASLDAELLLLAVLKQTRAYLYTYPDKLLSAEDYEHFQSFIVRRQSGEPVAYILGHKDFWDLSLKVTPDVLIPRPETELLVELSLNLLDQDKPAKLLDLGTGSGAIACSLAHTCSKWQVTATDISAKALAVAQENVTAYQLNNVTCVLSDWFENIQAQSFDVILSNPPYIEEGDPELCTESMQYEPHSALFSPQQGLADLERIMQHAVAYLAPDGWLLLEHGFQQGNDVRTLFETHGYVNVTTHQDLAQRDRVSIGQKK